MTNLKKISLCALVALTLTSTPMQANWFKKSWAFLAAGAAMIGAASYFGYSWYQRRERTKRHNAARTQLQNELEKESASINWEQVKNAIRTNPRTVNLCDEFGRTPLMKAATAGDYHTVLWLLNNGASIDAQDNENQTALSFACNEKNGNVIRLLVVKAGNRAMDKLHEAIALDNASALQSMLFERAQRSNTVERLLGWRDTAGNTALMLTAKNNSPKVQQFIFTALCNVDVNEEQRTNYLQTTNNLGENALQLEHGNTIRRFSEAPTLTNAVNLFPGQTYRPLITEL